MSEEFGSYLKHERELRGVPLDEIAKSTKISISYLRALEEGRFQDLPGEVFIKGFIRSYGQAIGSNVDELMAAYHETGSKPEDTETSHATPSLSREEESERQPSSSPMKAIIGFVMALLIIAGGVYWFASEKGKSERQPQKEELASPSVIDNSLPELAGEVSATTSEETGDTLSQGETSDAESQQTDVAVSSEPPVTVSPEKPPVEAAGTQSDTKNTVTVSENHAIIKDIQNQAVPETQEVSAEVATGESSLNLVIQVNEDSWFNLRIDDQRDQDFILPPGGSKTIQAKNAIVMTIGNRRATQLILNGQPMDLPESPDNVIRNLTVNAEQLN
jgi:cytoskeletal protein RodZ